MDDAMQGPPCWAGLVIADFTLTISLRDSYFHTKDQTGFTGHKWAIPSMTVLL